MKCFNCGYEHNDIHADHCGVCGVRFEHLCDSCNKPNPKMAKFCLHCGHDLKSTIEEVELKETRRHVAVIFADISGFTKLSENKDPEEVRDIINGAFEYILKPVYELEGSIDKYIGDCVMILFGAKHSHKDDVYRALKCAIDMNKRIKEYSSQNQALLGTDLKLSIGINYGLVVTGQVGNYYDKDYTVIGDVVNTAQRLQTSAPAGEIYVSESVYYDSSDLVDYSEPIHIEVKNKELPLAVYVPNSINTIREQNQLFSRQSELIELNRIMLSSNKFVNIIGESGLGKSSLVKEFTSNLDEAIKQVWLNGNQVARKPLGTISSIVMETLNINKYDPIRVKENRLKSFLDYILSDLGEEAIIRNYNFLAIISGLDVDDEFRSVINAMEYQDLRKELHTQIKLFFKRLAIKQTLIFIIEDAHFTDEESIRILKDLVDPNLMFITVSNTRLSNDDSNFIELRRLSSEETKSLIEQTLENRISDSFAETIYSISEGNPMLVLELVQSAKRRNLITGNNEYTLIDGAINELPSTLSGLIISKYDELDSISQQVLRVASVIGNEFSIEWINRIIEFDKDIVSKLVELSIIEFRTTISAQSMTQKVYGFTQNVIKETIYNNMLQKEKRALHYEVAKIIETVESGDYLSIAYHYDNANKRKLALASYYSFAVEMEKAFNFKDAIKYYEIVLGEKNKNQMDAIKSALKLTITLSMFDEASELINSIKKMEYSEEYGFEVALLESKLLKEKSKFEEALVIINELEDQLPKNSNLMGRILALKSNIYLMTGNPGVIDIAKESEVILTKSRDYESLADTMSYAGISSFMRGELDDAVFFLMKGYDYATLSNNLTSISKISTNLGIIFHASGETQKSYTFLQEAIESAEKVGSVKNQVSASINLGVFYMEKGRFNKAKPLFEETKVKAEENNLIYQQCISNTNLADLFFELGEYSKSEILYNEALDISKEYSLLYEEGVNNLSLAKLNLMNEKDATSYLDKALEIFTKTDELANLSDYYRIKAEYIVDENEENTKKAIDYAKQSNNELKELQAKVVQGVILSNHESFEQAKELAKKIESDYELAKVYYKESVLFNKDFSEELASLVKKFDPCKLSKQINELNRN